MRRSAIFWSVIPCSSLRALRKDQRVGLVHSTKDSNPMCQPSAILDDLGKPARTFWSSDPCQFVVLGDVSHVAGDVGLKDFPGVADVNHWNEGKGLDPLERSPDVRAQNFVLRDNVEAGEFSPSHNKQHL